MPNPFFRFKQFTVHHDRCAMKVGTDGVLLGAWADVEGASRILDVGAGSGLIALMLAQRNSAARIVGIDVDGAAVEQARENAAASPFARRIDVRCVSLQDFAPTHRGFFDAVVSNPPFFVRSLPSPEKNRTLARHAQSLAPELLISCAAAVLAPDGVFSFVYPYANLSEIMDLAALYNLFLKRQTTVFPLPEAQPKRVLLEFSKKIAPSPVFNELVVEEARHHYSEKFAALVRGFYLNL